VKIVEVRVKSVGEKGNKKIGCKVKHPDNEDLIEISSVRYERNGKLQNTGLWVNLDEDNKIRKNSALAVLMAYLGANNPNAMKDKECDTTEDEKGFLCFKAY